MFWFNVFASLPKAGEAVSEIASYVFSGFVKR